LTETAGYAKCGKLKNAFHISHSHDGGCGSYPNAKTRNQRLHKILDTSQAGSLFRLDYFRNGRLDLSIVGAYHTCRTRKIICSWWKNSFNSTTTSVDFRLDGNFGHTILRLNHRGLVSRDEYLWHRELWRGSLCELRSIF
jgi:hypothetical protein